MALPWNLQRSRGRTPPINMHATGRRGTAGERRKNGARCRHGVALARISVGRPAFYESALVDAKFGLYQAADFVISTGRVSNSPVLESALWYFRDETIALPRAGLPIADFTRGVSVEEDVARWSRSHPPEAPLEYPPLVWVAAPEIVRSARMSADGSRISSDAGSCVLSLMPKIALNRSYYNDASTGFLTQRTLTLRGQSSEGRFIARTIWPDDFRLDRAAPERRIDATALGLRSLVREVPRGGAQNPFAAMTLWERDAGARNWSNKPVLGVVLNGAQGDDDEAHGGHFALITGRVGKDGAIGDWLTNNFYTLDSFSEKGIIAAMLPLDNYLGDLNSGQSWYRPSYLLVAVLRNERIAAYIQGALARVYNQFYRHQLVYRHATMNCASISVDVLRALKWNVRVRGPTGRLLAAASVPYVALRERSAEKAVQMYDYLSEDRTRLFPAVAFEEIGADLLSFATAASERALTPFETLLAADLEALVFLRVPQLPSSRAWGDCPVVSTAEYHRRIPTDRSQQQIIPVPARPFPEGLRPPDLLPPPRPRGEIALATWAFLSIVGIPWLLWRWWRAHRGRRNVSMAQAEEARATAIPRSADPK